MALQNPPPVFRWGPNGVPLTYDQIALRQALEARREGQAIDTSPVDHWTQGAARVVDALGGALRERRTNAAAEENNQYNSGLLNELIGGGSPVASQGAAMPAPGASAEISATSPALNVDPSIRDGIVATAASLGIDPVDLGTAISYETAGTFDPTKRGPTTQWGQHRGLIQFGEPQAKEYGVDWNNPVGSQLGENGAVANYLRKAGVQPGMGMLDIYSAINAGSVGKYNASDANNGGAPGTVRDKVEQQMSGHRAKALALLGNGAQTAPVMPVQTAALDAPPSAVTAFQDPSVVVPEAQSAIAQQMPPQAAAMVEPQAAPQLPPPTNVGQAPAVQQVAQAMQAAPQAAPQSQGLNSALIRAISDPRANPQTKQIAQILIQQQQQKAAAQAEQQQWLARQQYEQQQRASDPAYQLGLRKTQAEVRNLENPDSPIPDSVRTLDLRAQRAGLQPGTPQYNEFMTTGGNKGIQISNEGAIPAGMQAVRDQEGRIVRYDPIPGSQAAMEAAAFADKNRVRNDLKDVASDTVVSSVDKALMALDAPGLPATGSIGSMVAGIPESNAAELRRQIGTIKSNITLDSLNAARAASPTGAALGAVSDKEGEILANKLGSIDPSSPNFKRDIRDVQKTYLQTIYGSEKGNQLFDQSVSLGDARAAIAKGAPREAVIKRLTDAGIDPTGL